MQDGRVWLKKGEVLPAVCVSDFRAPKVLYCIFFDGLGPVAQIPVPKGQTLTGQFYADVVLSEVESFYPKRRPKTGTCGIKILHDNPRPHKIICSSSGVWLVFIECPCIYTTRTKVFEHHENFHTNSIKLDLFKNGTLLKHLKYSIFIANS